MDIFYNYSSTSYYFRQLIYRLLCKFKESTVKCTERLIGAFCFEFGSLYLTNFYFPLSFDGRILKIRVTPRSCTLTDPGVHQKHSRLSWAMFWFLISTQRTPEEALIWLAQSHVNRLWIGHLKLSERGHNARPHYAVRKQLKIKLVKSLNRNQNTLFIWKITGE